MSEALKTIVSSLRKIPLVGWLLAGCVGLALLVVILLSRIQAQQDHQRRLVEAAEARRKLKAVLDKADEVEEEEKRAAREEFEKIDERLQESQRKILNLHEADLADEVNRFFEALEPKKKIKVEDLKP